MTRFISELEELYLTNRKFIQGTLLHVGLYSLALILVYNGYKEFSKGLDHVFSHFVGNYIDTPELPKDIRHTVRGAFPFAILIFTFSYYFKTKKGEGEELYLSYSDYKEVVFLADFLANLIFVFSGSKELLIILNLSFPVFIALLIALQTVQAIDLAPLTQRVMPSLDLTRVDVSLERLGVFALQERIENSRWFAFLLNNPILVFVLYWLVATTAYYPTIYSILRSDHWFFLTLTRLPETTLRDVAFFEMFGHFRFTPLRWLMFYAEDNLLGNNMVLYHLLSITVHALNGLVIFLIARVILGANIFFLLAGLLFIVFTSHFDTPSWSLLFDYQAGTLFYLLATLFLARYLRLSASGGSITNLYLALFLSMIPATLLECFVFGPIFILLPLFFWYYSEHKGAGNIPKQTYFAACGVLVFYVIYFAGATVFNPDIKTAQKGPLDILTCNNIFRGFYTTLTLIVNMNILNNLGIFPPEVKIHHLVYLYPPVFKAARWDLIKVILFLPLFVALFRYSRRLRNWYFTLPLILTALFYLSIICIGRIKTGGSEYILTRSHYAYFANAVFLIALGLIVWPPNGRYRRFIIASLLLLIVFNFKNTYFSNVKVAKAMEAMNTHFYRIKHFLETNPGTTLFLDFIPSNEKDCFSMCTDKAFDIAFGDRITKFVKRATHIYNSESFMKNNSYSNTESNSLDDFVIEWVSSLSPGSLSKEVEVVGSNKVYPRISITPGGLISVYMVNLNTGESAIYSVPYPKPLFINPMGQDWAWIVIEKHGKKLCFILNGVLYEKFTLEADYLGWQEDGIRLLGNYHRGVAENAQIGRLFIKIGGYKYNCGKCPVGNTFKVPISQYYQ